MSIVFSLEDETTPIVLPVPEVIISGSFVLIFETVMSSFVPTTLSSRLTFSVRLSQIGGSFPSLPAKLPVRESLFVNEGSSFVPTAMRPPGPASFSFLPNFCKTVISVFRGVYLPFMFTPGLISILSPTLKSPFVREPPNTPPTIFSSSAPGLLTSKLLAMNIFGSASKSLSGVGMDFSIV